MIPWFSVLTCKGGEEYLPRTLESIRAEYAGTITLIIGQPGPPENLDQVKMDFDNLDVVDCSAPHDRVPPGPGEIPGRQRVTLGHKRAIVHALKEDDLWTHFFMIEDDAVFKEGWLDRVLVAEAALTDHFKPNWALWVFHLKGRVGVQTHIPNVGQYNPKRQQLISNVAVLWCREAIIGLPRFVDERIIEHYVRPLDQQTCDYVKENEYLAFCLTESAVIHVGRQSRRMGKVRWRE